MLCPKKAISGATRKPVTISGQSFGVLIICFF